MKTGNVILAIFLFIIGGIGLIYGFVFSVFGMVTAPIGGLGIFAGGGLCLIFSFILIICGIVAIVTGMEKPTQISSAQPVIIQQSTPQPRDEKSKDEALSILRTRYAKGEITKEQFEQMKKDLEK